MNRLTSVSYGLPTSIYGTPSSYTTVTYGYDPAGNRSSDSSVSGSWTYDALNRMSASPGRTYDSDILGNRTTHYVSSVATDYIWDSLNRLIAYGQRSTSADAFYMGYRGDGMRMWKEKWVPEAQGNSVTQNPGESQATQDPAERWAYKYDGQMMVQETDKTVAGSMTFTPYLTGMRGVECSVDPSNHVTWFMYDAHGNVVATVDSGSTWGEVKNVRHFDAWGQQRGSTVRSSSTPKQGYCGNLGHVADSDLSGLVYMRARYYEASTGRFVSEDPGRDGSNLFIYVRSNPVAGVDSSGRFLDLLLSLLEGAEEDAKDGAAARAVQKYGTDKIYQAVAKYSGEILGYLIATELTGGYSKVGIYIKENFKGGRQINIDFVGKHFGDRAPH